MKRARLLITAILAIALSTSCKESAETGRMINNLDLAIDKHADYFARHKHEMDSIKSQLRICKDEKEAWRIYKKLHINSSRILIEFGSRAPILRKVQHR